MVFHKIDKKVEYLKHRHKMGFTSKEIDSLCKKLGIAISDFNRAFGINTCSIVDGENIYYTCDVERALWKLGHKLGKYHEWD